ncbi:hypothetical protein DEU35_1431 [Microbacterium sp. AG157]|uniref:hypothetical protein n=1 Tax=Microbacterium sp. AG157 TaxID=2183993 RepID=UPI000E269DF4|nr:hypothetical protein [Microbacterium sp. AG157]REC98331.1 hypothetical protein DEU35_1431 [Microbacterium sp. AG157]
MAGKAVPRFKNVSPLGALDVPALGRVITEGEEFDVREDLVPLFAGQVENYEPVNASAKAATAEALAPAEEPEPEEVTDGDDAA